MSAKHLMTVALLALTSAIRTTALADGFDLAWHTREAGGGMSTGGGFTLSGTISQHVASYLVNLGLIQER